MWIFLNCITVFVYFYCDIYINRSGGQLVYTSTECFPSETDAVDVKLSAIDTPELLYVQLCANLERSVVLLLQCVYMVVVWPVGNEFVHFSPLMPSVLLY